MTAYRWTAKGITEVKALAADRNEAWRLIEEIIGFSDFKIVEADDGGNVIAVENERGVFRANKGYFTSYWALYLYKDLVAKTMVLEEEKLDPEDEFFVITFTLGRHPKQAHGPCSREDADRYAISQIRNAADGVRVLVVKAVGEAKATFEVK